MKTTLLAVAVLWVGAAVAQAPDTSSGGPSGGPGPGMRHETPAEHLDHLATLLDLTDAQKAQVQTILEAEHSKMKALHDEAKASGTRPSFEQMKARHDQMQQELIAQLTPVLSSAQLKKFQVLMEERGPPGGHH
jgi:Spy/CpxP family protein refolding chaperone